MTQPPLQVLTDRFGSTHTGVENTQCIGLDNYCHGTWAGTASHLGYVADLNFLAIYTSPVTSQSPAGYHGYWPADWYSLNPSFGYDDDLRNLIQAVKTQGMRIMTDIVVNHVGYVDMNQTSGVYPFYNASNFHDCVLLKEAGLCDDCQVPSNLNLSIGVDRYLAQTTQCRLSGLPDLNYTQANMRQQLEAWLTWYTASYAFDGARIDAVGHIPPVR